MSKNSQTKRASKAKERARQRARDRHTPDRRESVSPRTERRDGHPEPQLLGHDEALLRDRVAAHELWVAFESKRVSAPRAVAISHRYDEHAFHDVATLHLLTAIERAYCCGFSPTEVVRQVRLAKGNTEAELCRWVIAADHAGRSGQRIVREWSDQIADEAPVSYVPASDWLAQFSREQVSRDAARTSMFLLVDVLGELRELDVLIAPPSGITPWSPVAGHHAAANDPVLNQIRALLAKAESSTFEAEASAFTAKAQQLMTKHAIDHAVLEAGRRDPAAPSISRIPLDPPYVNAKASLLTVVATHLRCRAFQITRVKMSTVVGAAVDLRAVELMFTSLLVQAQHALNAASANAASGSHERSQTFRSSFLSGFAQRISERLQEANERAFADDDRTDAYLPVLRAKDEALDSFIRERYSLTWRKGRGSYDRAGYSRGREAGDHARFGTGVISP